MRDPVKISTPFPTPGEVAKLLNISTVRARRIARMAEAIVEDDEDKQKLGRMGTDKRSGATQEQANKKKDGSNKA